VSRSDSEGPDPREAWSKPMPGIRLIPRWDRTVPVHTIDHARPWAGCQHPDCVVKDVMES